MSLQLRVRENNGVTIVDVSGRVRLGEEAAMLRDSFRDLSAAGKRKVLLNLAELSYLDSSGVGVLVSGFASMSNLSGQLKLLNLSNRVKDLLLITKLYTVFEVYDDEEVAVRSFTQSAAKA